MTSFVYYTVQCGISNSQVTLKGSDRQCMVVELKMQYCGKTFQKSFETYKTFPRCIITEFERKVDVQNHQFEWVRFQNRFFKSLNNDDEKGNKNVTVN